MLKSEWKSWSRTSGGRDPVLIDLVYELLKVQSQGGRFYDNYMVFELKYHETRWLFLVGVEDGSLNGEFAGLRLESGDRGLYYRWLDLMPRYVRDRAGDEPGQLSGLLTEAARLYKRLLSSPEDRSQVPPKSLRTDIDLTQILKDVRSDSRVSIRIVTGNKWELLITSAYGDKIEASATIYTNTAGFYCDLRVLAPRLAIGRNVNFGGAVSAPGLANASVSKTRADLVRAIGDSLSDEIPLARSGYDYTDEEYEASTQRSDVRSMPLGQFIVTVRNAPFRDSSSIIIDNRMYGSLLGEAEVLWLKLTNTSLGKEVWAIAHPSNDSILLNEVLVPDVTLVNLNCDPGATVHISRGSLPLVDETGIKMRLRGRERDTDSVLNYMERMSCLCVGATYSTMDGKRFDVLRAGKHGTCSLRASNLDARLEMARAVLSLDPLAVSYESDTDEESL